MPPCGKCRITINRGSSKDSECAVSVLVQYAMHLHVVAHAAHLSVALINDTNAFWCECLACTGLFYERLLDGRIDGNFYTLPPSCLYLLLSSLRYALTICVCVCARGSPGHVIFGAFDIITFDTTTLRV